MESEDGIADVVRHSDQATDSSPNAEQKPTQYGREHYRFGQQLFSLQRVFSITNGKELSS
jgi:hypothetical protein